MIARPLQRRQHLTREDEADLAELLRHARVAAADRVGLPADAPYWVAAENRAAMAIARADQVFGGQHDARTLLGALLATVTLTDLGAMPGRQVAPAAARAHDVMSMARWLRTTCAAGTRGEVYRAGAAAAAEALADPALDSDRLAAAWTSVCGLALLDVVDRLTSGSPVGRPSEMEIKLLQRVTAHCLATNRGVSRARLMQLTGTDRRTLAGWLRYGHPSPDNLGHLVPARHCATLVGVDEAGWRLLQGGLATPASRSRAHSSFAPPAPAIGQSSARWDEGEVMSWFESHEGRDCQGLCRRHVEEMTPAVVVAGGSSHQPSGGLHRLAARRGRVLHAVS